MEFSAFWPETEWSALFLTPTPQSACRLTAPLAQESLSQSVPLRAPKAPLRKGRWPRAKRRDEGIVSSNGPLVQRGLSRSVSGETGGLLPPQGDRRNAQQSVFSAEKEEGGSGYVVFGLWPETE